MCKGWFAFMKAIAAKRVKKQQKFETGRSDQVVMYDPLRPFACLPDEIIVHIVDFLDLSDSSRFSRSCKAVHGFSPKSQSVLELIPAKIKIFGPNDNDENRKGPEIPIPIGRIPHTITLETYWRDQGWGNRKGTLFIVANESTSSNVDFSSGRLVHTSPIADHSIQRLRMTFRPKQDEKYHLWIHVGGHGGHELIFETPLLVYVIEPGHF